MLGISLTVLAVASLGSAAQSVVSLFVPAADLQSLQGSIIGKDSSATTYVISCGPDVPSEECGFPKPATLTEGPATAFMDLSAEGYSGIFDCSRAGTTKAVCTVSLGGPGYGPSGMISTSTFASSDITLFPVTILPGSVTAAGASRTSAASTSAASTDPAATSSASSKSTNTANSAPSTSTSTAGLSRITGSGQWVVGGAAVAMAVAAL